MYLSLLLLKSERPGLSAPPLKPVIKLATNLWMNCTKHDVYVSVGFVIMGCQDRLMIVPAHVLQE